MLQVIPKFEFMIKLGYCHVPLSILVEIVESIEKSERTSRHYHKRYSLFMRMYEAGYWTWFHFEDYSGMRPGPNFDELRDFVRAWSETETKMLEVLHV